LAFRVRQGVVCGINKGGCQPAPWYRAGMTTSPRFTVLYVAMLIGFSFGPGCGGDSEGIGNSCEVDDDCQTNQCYIGPGGGYCTAPCTAEGDVSACPRDTVCKPIQGGALRCLLVCGSDSACDGSGDCGDDHCPAGSSCVTVDNTDHMACEPSP
jgi:hypothetical protein